MVKQSRKKSKSMSKVAAQNCRKRKLDQLDDLQVGVPSFVSNKKNRVWIKTDIKQTHSFHIQFTLRIEANTMSFTRPVSMSRNRSRPRKGKSINNWRWPLSPQHHHQHIVLSHFPDIFHRMMYDCRRSWEPIWKSWTRLCQTFRYGKILLSSQL